MAGLLVGGIVVLGGGAAAAAMLAPSDGPAPPSLVASAPSADGSAPSATSAAAPPAAPSSTPTPTPPMALADAPAVAANPAPAARAVTYVVKRGDTLSGIAAWFKLHGYGELYTANRAVIGSNPDIIRPGERISIINGAMSIAPPD